MKTPLPPKKDWKEKLWNATELLVLVCLLSIPVIAGGFILLKFSTPVQIDLKNAVVREDSSFGIIRDWQIVAERFAINHEFNLTTYNCRNFTSELKAVADQLGFNVTPAAGCKKTNSTDCHAWLKLTLDFEPQDAQFVDYSKEYNERPYDPRVDG